jgi:hypothetical protein
MNMAILRVEKFPQELFYKVKLAAVLKHMTLREFVIITMTDATKHLMVDNIENAPTYLATVESKKAGKTKKTSRPTKPKGAA